MKTERPSVSDSLLEKYLSWDRYMGPNSRVARMAFTIYSERVERGLPGTPEDDWKAAETAIKTQIVQELTGKTPQVA